MPLGLAKHLYPCRAIRDFHACPGTAGSEAGARLPPLVLVHGLVVSSRMMEPLLDALARRGLRALAPDLPGFGESAKPPRPLDLPGLADALALWLQASGTSHAIVVGASFGCDVIIEPARRHPIMVDRLVLQGPGPEPAARNFPRALWWQMVNNQREPRSLEPPRVCRSLRLMRGWSHDEASPPVFP